MKAPRPDRNYMNDEVDRNEEGDRQGNRTRSRSRGRIQQDDEDDCQTFRTTMSRLRATLEEAEAYEMLEVRP